MGKIVISENVSLDGLAAGERLFEWVGQIKGEAASVLLDEALGTEALLLGRRSYEFFAAVAIQERRIRRSIEQHAQVRRVLDPRTSCLEQRDGTQGRRGE